MKPNAIAELRPVAPTHPIASMRRLTKRAIAAVLALACAIPHVMTPRVCAEDPKPADKAETTFVDDWPTYLHDSARTGATDAALLTSLSQRWVHRAAAAPKPAWPEPQANAEFPKLKFDDAFYTVAVGDMIYFGSSVDHQVYALDAVSGAVRWRFFTGGPVRLAPTVADGVVYAGSDDGCVYALDARSGALLWRFDAAPEPRRVLGNGGIISLWPVRTSVLIDHGRAFFGAGVFPYHAPALHRLDARTGAPIPWKSIGEKDWLGLTPQGYIIRTGAGIVFPAGRSYPYIADAETGKRLFKLDSADRQKTGGATGVDGMAIDGTLFIGSQNAIYGFGETAPATQRSVWLGVRRFVMSDRRVFTINEPLLARFRKAGGGDFAGISAFDRNTDAALNAEKPGQDAPLSKLPSQALWRVPRADAKALIRAGDRLVVGCADEVLVLDTRDGKELWKAKVEGDAVGLTVAHGRLLVSTTRGTIHCFSAENTAPPAATPPRVDPAQTIASNKADVALVAGVVRESGARRGFALVIGKNSPALACELAKTTELRVTSVVEPARLAAAREAVFAAGLYGTRVTVVAPVDRAIPFPDFAANLVLHTGDADGLPIAGEELIRVLKPCGGVLICANEPDVATHDLGRREGLWSKAKPITDGGGAWSTLVRGQLAGSGWWTHAFANAGNTSSSGDHLVTSDLAVLWFGEPGAGEAIERHERTMPPLAINGRVFFQGWGFSDKKNSIVCFDAYNGLRYWQRDIPGAVRLRLPAVSGNLACTDDSLFVVAGSKCHRLDAATGETRAVYETPASADGKRAAWGYVSVSGGVLLGSTKIAMTERNLNYRMDATRGAMYGDDDVGSRFSDSLFAIDTATGKPLWRRPSKEIRDSMIVVEGGRVFFAENRGERTALPPRNPEGGLYWHLRRTNDDGNDDDRAVDRLGRQTEPVKLDPVIRQLVALELATGKLAWEKETDLTHCGIWGASASTREAAGYRELQALASGGVLLIAASYDQHDGVVAEDSGNRKAVALSTRDGAALWTAVVGNRNRPIILGDALLIGNTLRDLRTGAPLMRDNPATGKPEPRVVPNGGACGTPSACDAVVFFRHGSTAWRGMDPGAKVQQFLGIRPGCFTNILPVGGVVVQPEASSGCTCNYAVQCTLVLTPRAPVSAK